MSYWQPIDTAPRDGRHIYVANFDPDHSGFGQYDGVQVNWQAVAHWWGNPGEEGFYLSSGAGDSGPVNATHWAPMLPAPLRKAIREAVNPPPSESMNSNTESQSTARNELAPCPFCGGSAESDWRQGYVGFDGRVGNAAAIYCTKCGAQVSLCYRDMKDYSEEDVQHLVLDTWNRRDSSRLDALRAGLEEIRHDLINISVGGCNCGIKPPDPQLHELNCHYRMAETALARIEKARALLEQRT